MLDAVDFVILFLIMLLSMSISLFFILAYFCKNGMKALNRIFVNDLPHLFNLVGEASAQKTFRLDRAASGGAKKKENAVTAVKEDKSKWKKFEKLVGEDLAVYVAMIPDTHPMKEKIIDGALSNPEMAKMIISSMQAQGEPAAIPGAPAPGTYEFQE